MSYIECYMDLYGQKTKIYSSCEYTDILPQITDEDKKLFDAFICYIPEQFDSSKMMQYYYVEDVWVYLGSTSSYDNNQPQDMLGDYCDKEKTYTKSEVAELIQEQVDVLINLSKNMTLDNEQGTGYYLGLKTGIDLFSTLIKKLN